MTHQQLDELRLELAVKAKNGMDFILAAAIVWLAIAYVWSMSFTAYDKSVLTFIVGALMLPLALGFSKLLKTQWTVKENPLQSLGLWLNFAQLFYFPFLVYFLLKQPDYFVMAYVIITAAHFFPYAWFYNEISYAIMAGVLSVGGFLIAIFIDPADIYLVPLFMSAGLLILSLMIYAAYKKKRLLLKQEH